VTFAAIFGLGGHALLAAVGALLLLRTRIASARVRAGVALAIVVLSVVPVGGLSTLAYLRGAMGDLSITTVVLLMLALVRNVGGRAWMPEYERSVLSAVIGFGALVFYPLALGVGMSDPYAAGFGSPLMLGILLAAFIAAWWRGLPWIAVLILLGVAGWLGGVLESSSLWDYLLDPLIAGYAIGSGITRWRARWIGAAQAQ
jgi:hypothetical protein